MGARQETSCKDYLGLSYVIVRAPWRGCQPRLQMDADPERLREEHG
ncbi:hypothetical protein IMCC21906_02864 [Spongiibacter sp. IMCC21906]|nr:hypothetical protein IMCC21906_02864 [Spongiibacter sp. IMCC21906]